MTSLKFGTSGLRGLSDDLVGMPAREWTAAFLQHIGKSFSESRRFVAVGQDLRSSSPQIAADCMAAAAALSFELLDAGTLPTPALALYAMEHGMPAIMVTGSHIPDDRNGLKFYKPTGEIDKDDERSIAQVWQTDAQSVDAGQMHIRDVSGPARNAYADRYIQAFGSKALAGLRVGVYQHSSVAREMLGEILVGLGAVITYLGWSDRFIPVDTEAHRAEDVALIAQWAADHSFNAIVSTDGDADRPLVADETGRILRGDTLGLLTASQLGLRTVVTPVTSSSAVETSGIATTCIRTKVGSPFVIEAMEQASSKGATDVIGFEANGGVLLGSSVTLEGRLPALPTRDAILPIICALSAAKSENDSVRRAAEKVGVGYALADRLKDVPSSSSAAFLAKLSEENFARTFMMPIGDTKRMDQIDGVRFTFEDNSIIHFRASGNAPELRCYVEAETAERSGELLRWGLQAARSAMGSIK